MGRPREFDMDETLDRAMHVFWAQGYDGASLDDLLSAMAIGRGSLYKAFGDKRSLYLACLARYDAQVVGGAVRSLRDETVDARLRIARLLVSVAEAVEAGNDRSGCFLCNATVDQAPHDPDVAQRVQDSIDRLDAAFAQALSDTGAYPEPVRRTALAAQLTTDYFGLRVLAKSGIATERLRTRVDGIIAGLG